MFRLRRWWLKEVTRVMQSGWLRRTFDESYWRLENARIHEAFWNGIDAMERQGYEAERSILFDQLRAEAQESDGIVHWYDCRRLFRRAAKLGVRLGNMPLPEGQNSHYDLGDPRYCLTVDSFRLLEDRVRQAARERNILIRDWIAIIVAGLTGLIGAITGLVAVLLRAN